MGIFKKLISKIKKNQYVVDVKRLDINKNEEYSSAILKIMNLLNYTKKSFVSYSGVKFNLGYHSFEIDGHQFKGQRNPKMRLDGIPFSFEGLSVLDIGCNQGGMLYELSKNIRYGVGIDYDSRMINVANKFKSHCNLNHLDYYVFNLETENLEFINDFLPEKRVDVVFLLSVCMWIKNWKQVIDYVTSISSKLIFESNGSDKQQLEQINYLKKKYKDVQLIREQSIDDPSQKKRKLYYCVNDKG